VTDEQSSQKRRIHPKYQLGTKQQTKGKWISFLPSHSQHEEEEEKEKEENRLEMPFFRCGSGR